jgi:hypothetical protein
MFIRWAFFVFSLLLFLSYNLLFIPRMEEGRSQTDAAPKVSCTPQAGGLSEEMGEGQTMGWWASHQGEAQDAA